MAIFLETYRYIDISLSDDGAAPKRRRFIADFPKDGSDAREMRAFDTWDDVIIGIDRWHAQNAKARKLTLPVLVSDRGSFLRTNQRPPEATTLTGINRHTLEVTMAPRFEDVRHIYPRADWIIEMLACLDALETRAAALKDFLKDVEIGSRRERPRPPGQNPRDAYSGDLQPEVYSLALDALEADHLAKVNYADSCAPAARAMIEASRIG